MGFQRFIGTELKHAAWDVMRAGCTSRLLKLYHVADIQQKRSVLDLRLAVDSDDILADDDREPDEGCTDGK